MQVYENMQPDSAAGFDDADEPLGELPLPMDATEPRLEAEVSSSDNAHATSGLASGAGVQGSNNEQPIQVGDDEEETDEEEKVRLK